MEASGDPGGVTVGQGVFRVRLEVWPRESWRSDIIGQAGWSWFYSGQDGQRGFVVPEVDCRRLPNVLFVHKHLSSLRPACPSRWW